MKSMARHLIDTDSKELLASINMNRKFSLATVVGQAVVFVLVLVLWPNAAQARLYGVNRTVNGSSGVSQCSIGFSCTNTCDGFLEAKCQQEAPTYCNPQDSFVSASFGGVYPSSSCNVSNAGTSHCLFGKTLFLGTMNCSGSCNALCDELIGPCQCSTPGDCELLYGPPSEGGSWDCVAGCTCRPNFSPIVLHLPDYLSNGNGGQNWWKRGFCGAEAPTVCLDWAGDGGAACTAWIEPGSDIAILVAMSAEDSLHLLNGNSLRAEPPRHFFGNVTLGPEGDRPFAHGFAALATHCEQDAEVGIEIDLTDCGASLYAWNDRNADGNIDIAELVTLQDLGIKSLGDLRKTGKKDTCGNTFPFESHAICSNGKCGTWLDIFFESR